MDSRALLQHLKRGGVIAYPTESCYGLGCDPRNRDAVKKILRLKRRPQAKGLILIAASFSQLKPFVAPLSAEQLAQAHTVWPGPHTWLMPARHSCPEWLTGKHNTIAVRVTAHPDTARLCKNVGMALVSTSANLSGGRAARTARDCSRLFGSQVVIVPGHIGKRRKPSTIQEFATGRFIRS
jgi:L-threonylcarbamoyladenylate synthase